MPQWNFPCQIKYHLNFGLFINHSSSKCVSSLKNTQHHTFFAHTLIASETVIWPTHEPNCWMPLNGFIWSKGKSSKYFYSKCQCLKKSQNSNLANIFGEFLEQNLFELWKLHWSFRHFPTNFAFCGQNDLKLRKWTRISHKFNPKHNHFLQREHQAIR